MSTNSWWESLKQIFKTSKSKGTKPTGKNVGDFSIFFPTELVIYIFSFLDVYNIYNISNVNSGWKEICNSEYLWCIVYLKRWTFKPEKVLAKGNDNNLYPWKQMYNEISDIIATFNINSKKGMSNLIENGYVKNKPEEIALFLKYASLKGKEINKVGLAEFLLDNENGEIMKAFMSSFNFNNEGVYTCLQSFFRCLRLPNQQKNRDIFFRILSESYASQNRYSISDPKKVNELFQSAIVLNGDLHSGKIKEKMRKNVFIELLDSKIYGADILSELYDAVLNSPLVDD